jgi:RimJ/RimL family protein N-acetyltransferase
MAEAVGKIIRYGFEVCGFEMLVARAEVSNSGSRCVMEKLVVPREWVGTRIGRGDTPVDEVHYRLMREA